MEQLGIQPTLLLAQIINFAIIVVVLSKLLYKPILNLLEKRRKEIEEGLKITQRLRQEEDKLKARREQMLADARKEGHVVLEDARAVAKEEQKEILVNAREEAEDIIAKGKAEVERLRGELTKKLERDAVDLAVSMARRILTKTLSSQDQHKILSSHMNELERLVKKV